MNQIQELPTGVSQAGLEFNYSGWTANTVLTLVNVPWNSDYRDVWSAPTQKALDDYIDSRPNTQTRTKTKYAPVGAPIKLDIPIGKVSQFNYIRAYNPSQPAMSDDVPTVYYYFITGVEYVAGNNTLITVQLDLWQTFIRYTRLGSCYAERGHAGIADYTSFNAFGRQNLTVPEGLDTGSEYQVRHTIRNRIAGARGNGAGETDYSILVVSNALLEADPGEDQNKPNFTMATGSQFENLPQGSSLYVFETVTEFQNFLNTYKNYSWVMQSINSITAIPPAFQYAQGGFESVTGERTGYTFKKFRNKSLRGQQKANMVNWRGKIDGILPAEYRHLKKFYTSPYMMLELTAYNGKPLMLRPECWNDADMSVVTDPFFSPPSPRIMFYPKHYNAGVDAIANVIPNNEDEWGVIDDGGEMLDIATGIHNFPQFTILNNSGIAYLAGQANTLSYSFSNADWSQQKALAGAQLNYNQAGQNIATMRDQSQAGIDAANQHLVQNNVNTGLKAGIGVVGSLVGPQSLIGVAGQVANVVNTGLDISNNIQNNTISNNLTRRQTDISATNSQYMADTNKAYAEYAANGDYSQAIAGINAKVQDTKLMQPSVAGQLGGEAYNLARVMWGYDIKIKFIDGAAVRSVGDYWLRYGYALNRWVNNIPANFMCMEKFTYWKLRETYIKSAPYPEVFKQAIRGIFESGVTVWANPDDMGSGIRNNAPVGGNYFG